MSVKLYKNIHDITVFSFYKTLETGDYAFMVKDYEEDSDFQLSSKQEEKAKDIFQKILQDFNAINADKKSFDRLKLISEIQYLEAEYYTISKVLNIYNDTKQVEVLLILKEFDIVVDIEAESLDRQISKIIKKLKSIKLKIKIRKINFKKRFENEFSKEEKINFTDSLNKRSLILEQVLDKKYEIDPMVVKLSKWCEMIKSANNKTLRNG